jgi:hypothetical protein
MRYSCGSDELSLMECTTLTAVGYAGIDSDGW